MIMQPIMQPTTVIVVADKTSLKRPFIFFNGVNMALSFILLAITVAAHRHISDNDKLEEFGLSGVVKLYILGSSCLILSFVGVCGALKENRWCLIVFAVGMAAASQMMIVNTSVKYQPVYEKEVLNREASFLSMMPLSGASKNNRTLMDEIQIYYKCCGLVEGYADWGSSIPFTCVCEHPGRNCVRLRGNVTVGTSMSKNQFVYQEPCLHIYMASVKRAFSIVTGFKFGSAMFWGVLLVLSIKLMVQMKKKKAFLELLQTYKYCPPSMS